MAALIFWLTLGGLVGGFVKSVFWFEGDRGWLPSLLFGMVGGAGGGYLSLARRPGKRLRAEHHGRMRAGSGGPADRLPAVAAAHCRRRRRPPAPGGVAVRPSGDQDGRRWLVEGGFLPALPRTA